MSLGRTWLLLLALVFLAGAPAFAQTAPPPGGEKAPPPPLFPKHRRGFYINSDQLEVIDATPQSPPLEVDDPSVPDKGEYEINLLTEADFKPDGRSLNILTIDANYGVVLKGFGHELPTQLKFEAPIAAERDGSNPYEIGVGESTAGLKFNFYNDDNRGLRLSVYPQLAFSTGASVDKGVADAGQTFIFPLLVSHESKYVTLVANAGVGAPLHDDTRETMANLGLGAGRAFARKLAVMGEVYSTSRLNFSDERLVSGSVGVIYGVRKAIWYARAGHSLFSDDGSHFFLAFGMKMLIDTGKSGAQP